MGRHHRRVAPRCRRRPRGHPAICRHLLVPRISGRPLSPAFCPASSGRGVCPSLGPCSSSTICDPPREQRLAAVEWDPRVVLGVGLSLGRRRPPGPLALSPSPRLRTRRWWPLVCPVPAIVVPRPRRLLPGPRPCCRCLILDLVVQLSSSSVVVLSLSCRHPPPIPRCSSSADLVGI